MLMMGMMPRYSSLILVLLFLQNISFSKALNKGFTVEIFHRDSPKSPFYRSNETHFDRVMNAMQRSITRANHFTQSSVTPNTVQSTVIPNSGEYLMNYSVGTPPFKILGIVDTGSDLVWLQCQPCENCYNQTRPIFDPSESTTYQNLRCNSPRCQSVRSSCSGDGQTCEYSIRYGDGSHSNGDLSVDTLTLGSTDGSSIQFPKTVIGCGHDNTGTYDANGSGIVGLSLGPISLITQLNSTVEGKFSYCLAPFISRRSNSSSKLNFGDAAVVSGKGTVSTPIVQRQGEIFYFLTLKGFSVGNTKVDFGSSSSESGGEGNIIIDSGTTLTLLPEHVYSNLESAVADAVKLKRVDDPKRFFSLCYETTSNEVDFPGITAHFKDADVLLNATNTFVQVADGVICFAFRSSTTAIFGNVVQQNYLVGYDLEHQTVSFKPTDCTNYKK
ncbi:unnamed protein product [Sphenostylis stenocarpa]|uniref:Peptidase A1 domain-containing protein n=1 Tax=Sphenostylis stenocarpa TaxID=92480 RepID=A0AA86S415_9FABA|nr:unnamed protein product [Sphenostylis stenocarpa]